MAEQGANDIRVWVGNLGKDNEGELVGGWISLPVPQAELDRFLHDEVMIGQRDAFGIPYEEYAIYDHDLTGGLEALGYRPDRYTSVGDLNVLAAVISDMSAEDLAKVKAWMDEEAAVSDPLEVANYALQADEIPYHAFDSTYEGDHERRFSSLGHAYLEETPSEFLGAKTLRQYFDYEKFGRDEKHYVAVGDEGIIPNPDPGNLVDFEKKSWEEIAEDYPEFAEAAAKAGWGKDTEFRLAGENLDFIVKQMGLTNAQGEPVSKYVDALVTLIDNVYGTAPTLLEVANAADQIDEVPYVAFEDTYVAQSKDFEIGVAAAGDLSRFDNEDFDRYFDYKQYGEYLASGDVILCDDGYIDLAQGSPAPDYYSRGEIIEEAAERMGDAGFFESSDEVDEGREKEQEQERAAQETRREEQEEREEVAVAGGAVAVATGAITTGAVVGAETAVAVEGAEASGLVGRAASDLQATGDAGRAAVKGDQGAVAEVLQAASQESPQQARQPEGKVMKSWGKPPSTGSAAPADPRADTRMATESARIQGHSLQVRNQSRGRN